MPSRGEGRDRLLQAEVGRSAGGVVDVITKWAPTASRLDLRVLPQRHLRRQQLLCAAGQEDQAAPESIWRQPRRPLKKDKTSSCRLRRVPPGERETSSPGAHSLRSGKLQLIDRLRLYRSDGDRWIRVQSGGL